MRRCVCTLHRLHPLLFIVYCFCCHILKCYWLPPTNTGLDNIYISTNIWTFPLYLQTAQSTGPAAGVGGEGLAGMVLGSPRALSLQAHADLPADGQGPSTPHQWQVTEWQQAPPWQQPHALPAVITTLTLDLLTGPEVVEGHCHLLIEVGVGFYFGRGPWCFYKYCSFLLPPTLFCRLADNARMSWWGSAWSSATSNTGARGPPVRSCSSGWGASTGGRSFPPWPRWVFTPIVTYLHVFYGWQVCTSSLLFCRVGLIWRSPPDPSRWSPSCQEPSPQRSPCFR